MVTTRSMTKPTTTATAKKYHARTHNSNLKHDDNQDPDSTAQVQTPTKTTKKKAHTVSKKNNKPIGSTRFPYDLPYSRLDLRTHPTLYRTGIGEQGVLTCQPYKAELSPHWRFRTPSIASQSSQKLLDLFQMYCDENDFVGADLARKFIQMGFTRARRYANHAGGKKYYSPSPSSSSSSSSHSDSDSGSCSNSDSTVESKTREKAKEKGKDKGKGKSKANNNNSKAENQQPTKPRNQRQIPRLSPTQMDTDKVAAAEIFQRVLREHVMPHPTYVRMRDAHKEWCRTVPTPRPDDRDVLSALHPKHEDIPHRSF